MQASGPVETPEIRVNGLLYLKRLAFLQKWLGGFYDPKTFDPNFINKHLLWADFN